MKGEGEGMCKLEEEGGKEKGIPRVEEEVNERRIRGRKDEKGILKTEKQFRGVGEGRGKGFKRET